MRLMEVEGLEGVGWELICLIRVCKTVEKSKRSPSKPDGLRQAILAAYICANPALANSKKRFPW
jgi:hypothetical protein